MEIVIETMITKNFVLISDFTRSLGLNVTRFKDLFSIKLTDITVQRIIDFLQDDNEGNENFENVGDRLIVILEKIEVRMQESIYINEMASLCYRTILQALLTIVQCAS